MANHLVPINTCYSMTTMLSALNKQRATKFWHTGKRYGSLSPAPGIGIRRSIKSHECGPKLVCKNKLVFEYILTLLMGASNMVLEIKD